MRPLAVDLFCGLGGWAEGLLAEGWDVIGFDIERHIYGEHRYPAQLVLQDVLTLHGSQFRSASLIVASPPCQAYSYRAMPWKRAKALPPPDNALFDACFRIQREACEAAGRRVPMVVENVKGAQKWVGNARANFGSFFLWGDVPVPQPNFFGDGPRQSMPLGSFARKRRGHNWSRFAATGEKSAQWNEGSGQRKGAGGSWFEGYRPGEPGRSTSSGSVKRKAHAAMIAKIPEPLARHIARTYRPTHAA